MKIFDAIKAEDVETLQAMIAVNPNCLNVTDARGFTPLIMSTYMGTMGITKVLLAQNIDINAKDGSGNTALMGVCFKGTREYADILILAGANLDDTNMNGTTALAFSATYNKIDMVKYLLDKGANKLIKDKEGNTALDHAKSKGYDTIIAMLDGWMNCNYRD